MILADYVADEEIFIDANIFSYFALQNPLHQASCTAFLERVEAGQVRGVTSNFVLNEVVYVLLIGRGSELLNTDKVRKVKDKLAVDEGFAAQCYQACVEFIDYLDVLKVKGLIVFDVGYNLMSIALEMGSCYRLLPTDALHAAACQFYGIWHIATNDSHFEQVDFLQVWKP